MSSSVKPVDGSGGKGLVIGPAATKPELETLRKQLLKDPRGWIAQPVVQLSTIPTVIDDGMRPRHADLRPFAVNDGNDVWVLPGGLTRVALPEGQLVVNSSQGGGSKDTWVVGREKIEGRLRAPFRGSSSARPIRKQSRSSRPRCCSRRGFTRITPKIMTPLERSRRDSVKKSSNSRVSTPREVNHAESHRRIAVLDRSLH